MAVIASRKVVPKGVVWWPPALASAPLASRWTKTRPRLYCTAEARDVERFGGVLDAPPAVTPHGRHAQWMEYWGTDHTHTRGEGGKKLRLVDAAISDKSQTIIF